ncbi:Na-translocating system protein MpsC family protein [Pseudoneobacillus sp. C159]
MQSKKGKMEAELSESFIKLQRDLIGRGPQETKTYIVDDMVIARFKGVLTVEEKHLVDHEKGRILVKRMRQVLREMYSKNIEEIVEQRTGCRVLSSHSDISTKTGERIEVFVVDKDLEKWLESSSMKA